MSAALPVVRSWRVGERVVTLTIPKTAPGEPTRATAVWTPTEPASLSTSEWQDYRHGRHRALSEIAAELGISVAVLDL